MKIDSLYKKRIENHTLLPLSPPDLILKEIRNTQPGLLEILSETGIKSRDYQLRPLEAIRHLYGIGGHTQKIIDQIRDQIFNARKQQLSLLDENHTNLVVFVAETPYFTILRQSIALRRRGYKTAILALKPIDVKLRELFESSFDATIDGIGSLTALSQILEKIKPIVFHIQCWMWGYHIAKFIMKLRIDTPCVCEFYDITSAVLPPEKLMEILPNSSTATETVRLDLQMENYIFNNANAVIHRLSSDVICEITRNHKSSVETLEFPPYPLPEFSTGNGKKLSDKDGEYHLVFAGNLHPDNIKPSLSPIALMSKTFERIIAQGIHIDVFQDPNISITQEKPEYAGVFSLAKSPRFNFIQGKSPDQLAKHLQKYDYGINLTDFHPDVLINREKTMRGGIGTKQFSYLEAGIPSLISAEWTYASNHAVKHGYGIALGESGRKDIKTILNNTNYQSLIENVQMYNQENNIHNKIDDLINLYERLRRKT